MNSAPNGVGDVTAGWENTGCDLKIYGFLAEHYTNPPFFWNCQIYSELS